VELETSHPATVLHNGDGLCYYDLQKDLVGVAINRAEPVGAQAIGQWRVFPKDPIASFKDLRKGTAINRNRDMDWVRTLEKKSSDRRIGLWVQVARHAAGAGPELTDEDGFAASASTALPSQRAHEPIKAAASLRELLGRFGASHFEALDTVVDLSQPWFVPASVAQPVAP
jgi:hypothetical protein